MMKYKKTVACKLWIYNYFA